MKRILTIVGARPQFIKAAAISHTIREMYADQIAEDLLHTGQHYDRAMSDLFFDELAIPAPRYNLGIGSATHGRQTALMLQGIEEVLLRERYDGLLVYGDTNSTLAGALAAAKLHVPVYHVEAGLRSHNRAMPEELNRILTDHASTLLFAPTDTAMQNLWNEGFAADRAVQSGDVMLDNVLRYAPQAREAEVPQLPGGEMVLATVHRDFNTDDPTRLTAILSAIEGIGRRYALPVAVPLHPRTRKLLGNSTVQWPGIQFVDPLSYLQTLHALQRAALVLTDSGGLQKEACFCHRPCIVLRPETEWAEIVEAGAAAVTDIDPDRIAQAADRLIGTRPDCNALFGDGHAARRIVEAIVSL